jgi:hypothetical protein
MDASSFVPKRLPVRILFHKDRKFSQTASWIVSLFHRSPQFQEAPESNLRRKASSLTHLPKACSDWNGLFCPSQEMGSNEGHSGDGTEFWQSIEIYKIATEWQGGK